MAKVTIIRSWPDDDYLRVVVTADSGYPQELSEAKRVALDAFTEAVGVIAGVVREDRP